MNAQSAVCVHGPSVEQTPNQAPTPAKLNQTEPDEPDTLVCDGMNLEMRGGALDNAIGLFSFFLKKKERTPA